MVQNSSNDSSKGFSIPRGREKIIIACTLSAFFLYVNGVLIFTFFKTDYFRTKMRYIFFIHTLLCDWLFLFITNICLILIFLNATMPIGICLVICHIMEVLSFATPLTLTAMSLERYAAICMPLRHSQICSLSRTIHSIIIIHVLCSIEPTMIFFIFTASVPLHIYMKKALCQVEVLIVHTWQSQLRSVFTQIFFMMIFCIILFSYVKIMRVAKMASSGNSKSAVRGLKTVVLHGFQLLPSLVQLWCPFVEQAILNVDIYIYMEVRYFNYVVFMLVPRCFCPLVYGLRDEKFFIALKYYAFCAVNKKISPKICWCRLLLRWSELCWQNSVQISQTCYIFTWY